MKLETGCYGDGAFGHQHTRERCAELLCTIYQRKDGITGHQQSMLPELCASLRESMPDDAWDEYEACDLLEELCPVEDAWWGWDDGDFGLWTIYPEDMWEQEQGDND